MNGINKYVHKCFPLIRRLLFFSTQFIQLFSLWTAKQQKNNQRKWDTEWNSTERERGKAFVTDFWILPIEMSRWNTYVIALAAMNSIDKNLINTFSCSELWRVSSGRSNSICIWHRRRLRWRWRQANSNLWETINEQWPLYSILIAEPIQFAMLSAERFIFSLYRMVLSIVRKMFQMFTCVRCLASAYIIIFSLFLLFLLFVCLINIGKY